MGVQITLLADSYKPEHQASVAVMLTWLVKTHVTIALSNIALQVFPPCLETFDVHVVASRKHKAFTAIMRAVFNLVWPRLASPKSSSRHKLTCCLTCLAAMQRSQQQSRPSGYEHNAHDAPHPLLLMMQEWTQVAWSEWREGAFWQCPGRQGHIGPNGSLQARAVPDLGLQAVLWALLQPEF